MLTFLTMHSKSSLLQDVVVKVQAPTLPGESVCISGSTPELGQWQASKAIILTKTCPDGDIWSGVIKAPVDKSIQYRYMICVVLDTGVRNAEFPDTKVHEEHIVRQWESHLRPRVLSPSDIDDGKTSLSIFGLIDGIESIESGWLTAETVVQLKLLNNPVTIWKRRLRDKPLSVRVSTIDISRRDSEVHPFLEEDSTLTEGNQANSWPIVEVAVMNEENWQFSPQSQFGYVYEPGDYLTFQAQMIDPETIELHWVDRDLLKPSTLPLPEAEENSQPLCSNAGVSINPSASSSSIYSKISSYESGKHHIFLYC